MAVRSSRPGRQMDSSQDAHLRPCVMRAMHAGTAPDSAMPSSALGPPLTATSARVLIADAANVLHNTSLVTMLT